ncbi:MAG: hypothetical protein IJ055_04345 [Oscillospiraceae bacterium]|nr:hypothetical protein [Oscillospiraceae bacterium]
MEMPRQIVVDASAVNENPAAVFRGLGCVSGNGSSRLLMDYKYQFPQVYKEILRLLFEPGYGAGLSHLKLELGADINSSSGTEPCTMRSADETADVTRGAGFRLAADAKKLNPALTLDLLRWGEPHWVTKAFEESREAGFAARFSWYYETLLAAYETYGLIFDYISPDANETDRTDTDWLLYFAEHLKAKKDAPFDTSAIRIVASDEVGTQTIALEMVLSDALREAVDVIGLHYTTNADENVATMHNTYHKEVWYSEGIAPCGVPSLSCRADHNGLTGSNGAIDVANRIINAYAHSHMVMYEFQPPVCGYYDGSCYAPKQLITANEPWSGHYSVDIGLWVAAHFTRFAAPGWKYVDDACFGDGEENHVIWNTTHNYMTLLSPDHSQLTMHFTNDSDQPRSYLVTLRGLDALPKTIALVQTAGSSDCTHIDQNWFRVVQEIRMHAVKGEAAFPVVVRPHSILTATTMDVSGVCGTQQLRARIPERARLTLPYTMGMTQALLSGRDGAPLYTTDQGGAFELVHTPEGIFLEQKILHDALPTNWRFRGTPDPLTSFGDDSWADYQASAQVVFADPAPENYAALGIRYNSAVTCPESSACGFSIRLYADGRWEMRYMDEVLAAGDTPSYQYEGVHRLGICAIGTLLMCFVDGHSVHEQKLDDRPIVRSGRMWLQSAYYRNRFSEITAKPLPFSPEFYCYRFDCMAPQVRYIKDEISRWSLQGMAGYQFFHRTCAQGSDGCAAQIRFYGSGIRLIGRAEGLHMSVWLDGDLYSEDYSVRESRFRECFLAVEQLHRGWHILEFEIQGGTMDLDVAEIPTADTHPVYDPSRFPEDPYALTPAAPEEKARPSRLGRAAIPLAGAAATGLAVAFTVGKVLKRRKKK